MALWTPDLYDPAIWLSSKDEASVTLASSVVSQWADKSQHGRHAAQGSSSLRPAYDEDTEGRKRITFSSDQLDAPAVITGTVARTIYVVASMATTQSTLISQGAVNVDGHQFNFQGSRTAAGSLNAHTFGGMKETAGEVYTAHTPGIFCAQVQQEGTSSQIEFFFNGSPVDSSETQADPALNTSDSAFRLGNRLTATAYLNGSIYEVLVFLEEHTAEQRQTVEGYLAHHVALTGLLPAEHPYKIAAPTYGFFHGTVIDKDGNPAERRISVLDATGQCVATDTSDPLTGAYEIDMPNDDPYTLVFDGEPDRNAIVYANVIPEGVPE